MYLIMSYSDNPIILTKTLADAEELAADMEMQSRYERFCALMIKHNMTPKRALEILKGQYWQYRIREIGVI